MIKQWKHKNVTWIDLVAPTREEIEPLIKDYKLHPLAAEELLGPSQRSKVDVYDDFIYLILHFPHYHYQRDKQETSRREVNEVDFIIGKDFVITTSYETIEPMQEFGQIFQANLILDKNKKDLHAGYIFYYIIRHLYQSLEITLDNINLNLRRAERNVFAGRERQMVMVLSDLHRELLDFRWALKSHKETLASLEIAGSEFFGTKFSYYLRAINGEYEKIWNLLENNRELFYDLRNTNDSQLSIKTNAAIKGLTMLAFVTFPLTLIATLFSMGARATPIIGGANDFWLIVGLMAGLLCLMLLFFRIKKWL